MALEIPCPYCGTQMYAEHAHNRCPKCLYVEPCCDGAALAACRTGDAGSSAAERRTWSPSVR